MLSHFRNCGVFVEHFEVPARPRGLRAFAAPIEPGVRDWPETGREEDEELVQLPLGWFFVQTNPRLVFGINETSLRIECVVEERRMSRYIIWNDGTDREPRYDEVLSVFAALMGADRLRISSMSTGW